VTSMATTFRWVEPKMPPVLAGFGISKAERERLDDRHEDVDDVVAPVVLERRPRAVSIPPLREALRSRADLLVNLGGLAVQTDASVPPARERAALGAKCRGIVAGAQHRAHAVGIRRGIKGAEELSPAQPDCGLELGPGPLNLGQLVGDSDEHHLDRLTYHDVLVAHARKLQARNERAGLREAVRLWVRQCSGM